MPHPGDPFASRLLRQELVVAYGCSEPAALALAAAAAAEALEVTPESLLVTADEGTFKNALSVGLPGTALRGPEIAAAAGMVAAAPDRRLEIFRGLSAGDWRQASELVGLGRVRVLPRSERRVWIEARAERGSRRARARIAGRHDRLISVAVTDAEGRRSRKAGRGVRRRTDGISDGTIRDRLSTPGALLRAAASLSDADLAHVETGTTMNRDLAARSFAERRGRGFARAWSDGSPPRAGSDPAEAAKAWVAAGIEARMSGVEAPVMASGGSGNSGLTVSLGVWAAATALGIDDDLRIARATALAHLVNVAIKARIGRVGPLCGAVNASAAGVGCAVAWLLGGDVLAVDRALRHVVAASAGTLCDGAKPECALKVAAGLDTAIDAGRIAARGGEKIGGTGLAGATGADALERLGRLAEAYAGMDAALLPILRPAE